LKRRRRSRNHKTEPGGGISLALSLKDQDGTMRTDYTIGVKRLTEITSCPKCGSKEVREKRQWSQHTNGFWNESVEFSCSAKYEFSPNFMLVGLSKVCTYDPEYRARKELTASVRDEIFALAKKRGIHDDEMASLKSSLQYWHPSSW
jgi:hypothetical protein